jgi:16S rRNA (uracil1498-N3)-methyltransferase
MPRHRFYAQATDFNGSRVILSPAETHHLIQVLRTQLGEEVFVFDGAGREFKAVFASTAGNRAEMELGQQLTDPVESSLHITLAQGISKGERFDLIVQKTTELGVNRIIPLITRYTDVKLTVAQSDKRLERWSRISLEALKQCGRRTLVDITAPMSPAEMIAVRNAAPEPPPGDRELFLVFNEKGGVPLTETVSGGAGSRATIAIGPEGGWSDGELSLLMENGCKSVTLGPRILRTETAAVAAITLVQHAWGDLSR